MATAQFDVHERATSPSTATPVGAARPSSARSPARPTCSCRPPTGASSSTTSSASSAARATSCATRRARSPGPTRKAATASSSAARERRSPRPIGPHPMIAACLKWVDLRPEVDASGAVHPDDRFAGVCVRRSGGARAGPAPRRVDGNTGDGADARTARSRAGAARCARLRGDDGRAHRRFDLDRPQRWSPAPSRTRSDAAARRRRCGAGTTRSTAAPGRFRRSSPRSSTSPRRSAWSRCCRSTRGWPGSFAGSTGAGGSGCASALGA